MRLRITAALVCACLVAALVAAGGGDAKPLPAAPTGFFGIGPQTPIASQDVEYMRAGGIESIRWPLLWSQVQPTKKGGYDWSSFDQVVEVASKGGLSVLPVITSTPRWVASRETTMPVNSAAQQVAWQEFLRAAAARYGPGGEFWKEHSTPEYVEGVRYEAEIPKAVPIRTWQIWNEANYFYFAFPVSPVRYGKLVTISSVALKSVQPGAKLLLSGLFGEPSAKGSRGMPAATFLKRLYAYPGIKSRFDGVALHPYAVDSEKLEELVEAFHEVLVENHDRPAFYITEMGWGSQNDFADDAFEQGPSGQVRELRASYAYLLENQRRLNLRGVYWFSWKDLRESCNFCDSVGFFPAGTRFKPKPSWRAFIQLTGGSLRP
ncbi:MAG TPA: hypothetical protein VMT37_07460 [Solirubrobacterales bacterium]|nr:hypothetical protein [Solirubrobacterales bacterium]